MRMIATLILALACAPAFATDFLDGSLVGVHLATVHVEHNLENFNPGFYFVHRSGFGGGFYKNSFDRWSVHVDKTWCTDTKVEACITLGAVSGYARPLIPMVVPSVRIPLVASSGLRLALLPRAPEPLRPGATQRSSSPIAGVHFSIDWRF